MAKRSSSRGARGRSEERGIVIEGLGKSLRGHTILDNLSLTVPRGSVAVVEGSNGAGKTTLIRVLATVVTPDTGTVSVNGFDAVRNPAAIRASVGVSFANERSLYWRITGYQNLELFGRIAGLSKGTIERRSAEILDSLVMADIATKPVAQMSTGQRQRLMIARALIMNPEVLLLDEPFRGLDDVGLQALIALVRDQRARGLTTLIVAPLIDAVRALDAATYRLHEGALTSVPSTSSKDEGDAS